MEEKTLIEIKTLLQEQNDLIRSIKEMNQQSMDMTQNSLIESKAYMERNENLQKSNSRIGNIFYIVTLVATAAIILYFYSKSSVF